MQHGIIVYRASRLEALLPPLLSLMDAAPPAHPLQPHDVIAAHPGIRQWLARAIARERGPGSIAANLAIELPSAWLDRLARHLLGESAIALRPYRREALRWRIHEALPEVEDTAVYGYLRGIDAPRRRFQLADRIAAIYTRYLVYRPDWLQDWAEGRNDVPAPTFLAALWRRVREGIALPHRGERLSALIRRLDSAPAQALTDEPLHVFGISHLAPTEFAALRAVARRRPVVFYVPDPCREYWAGLKPEREYLKGLARLDAFSGDAEQQFLALGHPLLASWGRLGQHFVLALAGAEDVTVDIRHSEDENPATDLRRLARLQDSIRQLDPQRLVSVPSEPGAREDRSLRVHACHTRLRELEVLRDVLLREREENPALKPSDIVVMAPDIQAYVALLPAVFGEAGRAQGPLPYHLADVPVMQGHGLLLAFANLMELPFSRVTAAQVLDLLAVAEIARALGLDAAGVELLSGWIARSRVAWALDPDFRARVGVPAIAEHTFAWGMDRLLAGYLFGSDGEGESAALGLPDGEVIVPVEGIHGVQAEVLGALDRLLQVLAQLCRDATQRRSLRAWSRRCDAVVGQLFRVEFGDAAASDAIAELRRLILSLETDADDAGVDVEVEFSVVRDVLRERLSALSERQRFLVGGMTVCGMVPQRAIPFRVVAVLGLNDGEFPRAGRDAGLDLMATHRRLGDRDVRSDDRYLFLETVMAARDVLHLSYIGEGVRDGKPRNPAAPLAELLALLDLTHGLRGVSETAAPRPWLVRHPLQPFDARYFDASDPRLYSYRADLLALLQTPGVPAPAFLDGHDASTEAAPESLALAQVLDYFRRPAQHLLRQHGLRLDALEPDRIADSEPLDARFARFDRVAQRLFFDALTQGHYVLPPQPPDWLRYGGLWPPARAGEQAWASQRQTVDAWLDEVASSELGARVPPRRLPLAMDLPFAAGRLQGELTRAYRTPGADWILDLPQCDEAALDFGQRIGLFLEWALLQLASPPRQRVRVLLPGSGDKRPWQRSLDAWNDALLQADAGDGMRAALARRVDGLLAIYARAQRRPLWYFPKTSWIAADPTASEAKILYGWIGNEHSPGEQARMPGYERLFASGSVLEPGAPAYAELVELARELRVLITLDAERPHD
ncbi:MAG: exodeoxyribonuclease V subunit gamma [Rhodanobacteraceae bacterium]|nr:exodeoxyribonuclease V subunit gamma [Rhodanobacteraceae bacterium]